jgi:hypothetical protein
MTNVLFLFLALLEIVTGAGVFASAKGPIREVLGTTLIGFGILSLGIAGLQREMPSVRREAAEDRKAALQERQARAAAELKRRSVKISSIDRESRKTGNATTHRDAGAASYFRNGDSIAGSAPLQPRSRSPQLRSPSWERRLGLLASSANIPTWTPPQLEAAQRLANFGAVQMARQELRENALLEHPLILPRQLSERATFNKCKSGLVSNRRW